MTASYKRLIPCILIAGGKAVTWFDDKTLIAEDVIGLAKYYSDHGADELIVFDLSDSDDQPDHPDPYDCGRQCEKTGGCEKNPVRRGKTGDY